MWKYIPCLVFEGVVWIAALSDEFDSISQLSANASSWLERANNCDNLGSDSIEYLVGVDFPALP